MHFTIEQHLSTLSDMVEKTAESLEETSVLINELHQFEINSKVIYLRNHEYCIPSSYSFYSYARIAAVFSV